MGRIAVLAVVILMIFSHGCGVKPPLIPEGVTVAQILDSLYRQSTAIKDFSGWAKVKGKFDGKAQSVTTVIRFIAPN